MNSQFRHESVAPIMTFAIAKRGPTPSANSKPSTKRKLHETCSPLSKPIALSQELPTKSRPSHSTGVQAELRFSSAATIWCETATGTRLVAQKQSTRLITGRRRSVTCRDDSLSPGGYGEQASLCSGSKAWPVLFNSTLTKGITLRTPLRFQSRLLIRRSYKPDRAQRRRLTVNFRPTLRFAVRWRTMTAKRN